MHVWPIYGGAVGIATVRGWVSGHRDIRIAALALASDWLASNLARWTLPFDYRLLFRETDLAFASAFAVAWLTFRKDWMAVLASLYLISGLVGFLAYDTGAKYSFDLALNAAFLARLAVVWIASEEPRKLQERI